MGESVFRDRRRTNSIVKSKVIILIKKYFIAFVLFFLFPIYVYPASWYMDSSASGTNAGTSWTNAWHGFDHVVWGGAGVVAGDTLYISGGSPSKTYTAAANNMLTVGASGSSGSPITIATGAKSPSPSGHDGTVIFEGGTSYYGLINTNSRTYIIIDGEKSGARNWTLQNTTSGNSEAAAIEADSAHNLIVTYLTIQTVGMGIYATYANALTVSYCSITGVIVDTAIRNIVANSSATEYGLAKYHHNNIQINVNNSTGAGPDGIQSGKSSDIYNNTFSSAVGTVVGAQHPDYVQSAGQYHRIYNNVFRNPIDSSIDVDAGTNWDNVFSNLLVYNNIFTSDSDSSDAASWPSGVRVYNGAYATVDNIIIANNTFVDLRGDGTYSGRPLHITPPASVTLGNNIKIQNNIFYNTGDNNYSVIEIAGSTATAAQWGVDYNLVNAGTHGSTSVIVDGSAYTQSNPRTGTPTFVSYAHTSSSNDYALTSGDTAAKDQGVDLSAYFSTDKLGVTRSGTWDIGAYEYGGTPASISTLTGGTLYGGKLY
jgi:hypothetical protein